MPRNLHADSQYIWLAGEVVPYAEANVHMLSHSLHYGSAAFEGIRAYKTAEGKTAIFRAEEHFKRFEDSIKLLSCAIPYSIEDLIVATRELIKANKFEECYVRPIAFLDDSVRGLKLPDRSKMLVGIAVWKWGQYLGEGSQAKGIDAVISSYRRADPGSSLPWAKVSGGYLTSILARREASLAGVDEAILLDHQGYVAEGSGENIFVVQKGEVLTPPSGSILLGITRDTVLDICKELKIPVREAYISRNQLYGADEAFFTGTAVEVTPIRSVDFRVLGKGAPGKITQQISAYFQRIIRGHEEKFKKWLCYL